MSNYTTTPSRSAFALGAGWRRQLLALLMTLLWGVAANAEDVRRTPPEGLRALSRQLRVDLLWNDSGSGMNYEVQRAAKADGPFNALPSHFPGLPIHSDFIGSSGSEFYYRVRSLHTNQQSQNVMTSDWTAIVKGSPQALDTTNLLTEVQEASFRYFYDFGHPVSGLAREGTDFSPDFCAIGASGMGLFNLAVGIERNFINRQQGAERTLKMLRFLSEKAERFHGAFPHFLNGRTGKAKPFFQNDDGADLVETAFLMQGILFVREYFSGADATETEIQKRADALWRGVEWDWFADDKTGIPALIWHWSPAQGWKINLHITGFNECHIVYLLALASPTHAVSSKYYWRGWESAHFGEARTRLGISLQLGHDYGPPMFWTHYSYLGFDPHQITYRNRNYFEHFKDLSRVQVLYAESKSAQFRGYGPLWGITASIGPDGYRAFSPGQDDNGTLAPTAVLSSMPYAPEASRACLVEMYEKHGAKLWGPFGFYDSFNLTRDWVADNYLGIDVGPIAPMIENYRSGFCWKVFMQSPEIHRALKLVEETRRPASSLSADNTSGKTSDAK